MAELGIGIIISVIGEDPMETDNFIISEEMAELGIVIIISVIGEDPMETDNFIISEEITIAGAKIDDIKKYKSPESVVIAAQFSKKGDLKWHTQN